MKNKKLIKIGGSIYVALEPYLIKKLELKEGDEIDQNLKSGKIIITKVKEGNKDADTL